MMLSSLMLAVAPADGTAEAVGCGKGDALSMMRKWIVGLCEVASVLLFFTSLSCFVLRV
jgi:hypothetical protein